MDRTTPENHVGFSVDTHLFRELGTLLVGRDSTALVELIKNAYDADARSVVVHSEGLKDSNGFIQVSDDGHGMTYEQFRDRFLRIAGRSKDEGDRRSPTFRRTFTGAKGIGRLSAYKLAGRMDVESVPGSGIGVVATIDWEELETSHDDLQDAAGVAARRRLSNPAVSRSPGTVLLLRGLKLDLAGSRRTRFLDELRATRPDPLMFGELDRTLLVNKLLMPLVPVADAQEGASFDVRFTGELDAGDQPWLTLGQQMDWLLEIDGAQLGRSGAAVRYRLSPTAAGLREHPTAVARDFVHVRERSGPSFRARIFIRDARIRPLPDLLERFSRSSAGIRLYMEGFRVLPYGAPGNDWLEIDRDAVRRNPVPYADLVPLPTEVDERTYQLSNRSYFGAVLLQEATAAGLQMVVNREGFLPGADFEELAALVRRGIDLSVRARAAVGAAAKTDRQDRRRNETRAELEQLLANRANAPARVKPRQPTLAPAGRLERLVDAARDAIADLRTGAAPSGKQAEESIRLVAAVLDEATSSVEDVRDEQSQLRVLASVGTQFAAFIHEVNGLLGQARVILQLLDSIIEDESERSRRTRLAAVRRAMQELVASLERQAIYLTDTVGAEARRRRSRQLAKDRLATALRLLRPAAEARGVKIIEDVDASLRTPAMFPAEVNIIFSNLLSNAIKAAAPNGIVQISAARTDGALTLRIQNTGRRVMLEESERWFRPFETTTTEIDAVLGQGMGLGLPLTRRIVEEYGGDIGFVQPDPPYSTAILVTLPTERR